MGFNTVRTCHVFYGLYAILYHEELPTDRKKATTVRLDKNLLQTAHDLGLNVSRISENALIDAVNRLSNCNNQTLFKNHSNRGFGHNRLLARGVGFEPTRPFPATDLAGLPPTRLGQPRNYPLAHFSLVLMELYNGLVQCSIFSAYFWRALTKT